MTDPARIEIERRFLVDPAAWSRAAVPAAREPIVQFYLAAERKRTVRIRLSGGRAVLTIKGESAGAERTEIECEIPLIAAEAVLETGLHAGSPIEKTRTTLELNGIVWEVDVFEGANAGLVIAEAEFRGDAAERVEWEARVDRERPEWLRREITGEHRFANSSLALHPFAGWPSAEREQVLREVGG